jgi:hypothetical protein
MYGSMHLQYEILGCTVKYFNISHCNPNTKLWYDKILHYFVIFLVFVRRERKRESERARERDRQTDRQTHPPTAIYIYIINEQPVFGQAQAGFLQLLLGVTLETCAWNAW